MSCWGYCVRSFESHHVPYKSHLSSLSNSSSNSAACVVNIQVISLTGDCHLRIGKATGPINVLGQNYTTGNYTIKKPVETASAQVSCILHILLDRHLLPL